MTDSEKVRALALLEGGMRQNEVAARLKYSVKTIRRLQQAAVGLQPGEVPQRRLRPGSGKKKSYGAKERGAIKRAITANPKMTALQLKTRLPKTAGHLSRRTINNIVREELGRRSGVAAVKPFLTNSMREDRLAWAAGHRYWGPTRWGRYLYGDESYFMTKNETGGRRVRRPEGSSRFDPKYTKTEFKWPQQLMVWACISASGRRLLHFCPPNTTMTASRFGTHYISLVKLTLGIAQPW